MITWNQGMTLEQLEREVILKAFRLNEYNKTATAATLGISVRTLYDKLESYGVGNDGRPKHADSDATLNNDEPRRTIHGGNPSDLHARDEIAQRERKHLADSNSFNSFEQRRAARNQSESAGIETERGLRVESSDSIASEQPLPVSERQEVQSVPPQQVAVGGSNHKRGGRR